MLLPDNGSQSVQFIFRVCQSIDCCGCPLGQDLDLALKFLYLLSVLFLPRFLLLLFLLTLLFLVLLRSILVSLTRCRVQAGMRRAAKAFAAFWTALKKDGAGR